MNEDLGLFADILEHPHDDAPRLIYADWLDDRAGPGDAIRAAFIRLQIEIAHRASVPLVRREKALLAQNGRSWSRSLRPILSRPYWKRGFVETASVYASALVDCPDNVLNLAPLCRLRFRDPAGHIGRLANCAALTRLEGISVAGGRLDPSDISTLVGSPHLTSLRELDLAANDVIVSHLDTLLDRLPNLEALGLARVAMAEEGVARLMATLPAHITSLDLQANALNDDCVSHFAGLPLRRLAVGRNNALTAQGLNRLVESLPALEILWAGGQPRGVRDQLQADHPQVLFDFGQTSGMWP